MSSSVSVNNLKRRPKPVLNKKIKRFKDVRTSKTGFTVHHSPDETTKSLANINNKQANSVLPLSPEKLNLFPHETLLSSDLMHDSAKSAVPVKTVSSYNVNKNNLEGVEKNNEVSFSSLNGSKVENISNLDDFRGSHNESLPGLPSKNDLNSHKMELKNKNRKSKMQIACPDKLNRGKRNKKIFVSKLAFDNCSIDSNVAEPGDHVSNKNDLQSRLCSEFRKLKQKSDSPVTGSSTRHYDPCRNVVVSTQVNRNCAKDNILYVSKTSGESNDSYSTVKVDSPVKNMKSSVNSSSWKNKQYLKELRLKAYDDDGNLNKKRLTLRDYIYFNPPHNPMTKRNTDDYCDESDNDDDCLEDIEEEIDNSSAAPQVKVGADGKIIVNRESLIIKRGTDRKMVDLKNSVCVKEDEYSNRFKRRKRKEDTLSSLLGLKERPTTRQYWTLEETLKFYKVLNEFGCDFTVMMGAFPSRTRRQLKRKFLIEEKARCKYIDLAMTKRDSIDFCALEKELRKKDVKKEGKNEERQKLIEEKKERKRLLQLEYAKYKNSPKSEVDWLNDPGTGVRRSGVVYEAKVKRMRKYIERMKSKYVTESGEIKNKLSRKDSGKDVSSDDESYLFDLKIPLYKKPFCNKQEEIFIQEILTKDDLDIFIGLISHMYRNLGKDWRDWAKRKTIDQLLLLCNDNEVKQATIEMKTAIDEQDRMKKLEGCYQLFSDPFDFVDPIDKLYDKFI